jgi:hypothetical protein
MQLICLAFQTCHNNLVWIHVTSCGVGRLRLTPALPVGFRVDGVFSPNPAVESDLKRWALMGGSVVCLTGGTAAYGTIVIAAACMALCERTAVVLLCTTRCVLQLHCVADCVAGCCMHHLLVGISAELRVALTCIASHGLYAALMQGVRLLL